MVLLTPVGVAEAALALATGPAIPASGSFPISAFLRLLELMRSRPGPGRSCGRAAVAVTEPFEALTDSGRQLRSVAIFVPKRRQTLTYSGFRRRCCSAVFLALCSNSRREGLAYRATGLFSRARPNFPGQDACRKGGSLIVLFDSQEWKSGGFEAMPHGDDP
jgi:hypothetical protein